MEGAQSQAIKLGVKKVRARATVGKSEAKKVKARATVGKSEAKKVKAKATVGKSEAKKVKAKATVGKPEAKKVKAKKAIAKDFSLNGVFFSSSSAKLEYIEKPAPWGDTDEKLRGKHPSGKKSR